LARKRLDQRHAQRRDEEQRHDHQRRGDERKGDAASPRWIRLHSRVVADRPTDSINSGRKPIDDPSPIGSPLASPMQARFHPRLLVLHYLVTTRS
jgi:hypothetical protein